MTAERAHRDEGSGTPDGDVTDPAYWARPRFAIRAPDAPPLHSKLCCLRCREGTAYSDGTGGYTCFRCGWTSSDETYDGTRDPIARR